MGLKILPRLCAGFFFAQNKGHPAPRMTFPKCSDSENFRPGIKTFYFLRAYRYFPAWFHVKHSSFPKKETVPQPTVPFASDRPFPISIFSSQKFLFRIRTFSCLKYCIPVISVPCKIFSRESKPAIFPILSAPFPAVSRETFPIFFTIKIKAREWQRHPPGYIPEPFSFDDAEESFL